MQVANDNDQPTKLQPMLTVRTVCHKIGLSHATVYRLRARGEFPEGVYLTPNSVRWSERAIAEWVAEKATKGKRAA